MIGPKKNNISEKEKVGRPQNAQNHKKSNSAIENLTQASRARILQKHWKHQYFARSSEKTPEILGLFIFQMSQSPQRKKSPNPSKLG